MNIHQPISVNLTRIDKIEVQIVSQELIRLEKIYSTVKDLKAKGDLLNKLREAVILQERTRDPELQQIIQQTEVTLK